MIKISEATEKHFQLQIRTLQDAPRDAEKLRELLKEKQKEYEKAETSSTATIFLDYLSCNKPFLINSFASFEPLM